MSHDAGCHQRATEKKLQSAEDFLYSVDTTVREFESAERSRRGLGNEATEHWHDPVPSSFTAEERHTVTLLHSGFTLAHDFLIQSAFRGQGYQVQALEQPDVASLQTGREYGNRGQCNPTYFTVGNLVKHLQQLEAGGLSKQQIVKSYVFVTAGSCGPCRFGTYVTEYRKALRDSGFDGFRVLLFQQSGGLKQATGERAGLDFNTRFFLSLAKAVVIGDVLNLLGYRIRPYERHAGQTNRVLEEARQRIAQAFESGKGLWLALHRSRRALAAIEVDLSRVRPRVAIIGEFWAMTTEGDGNYRMQAFLEQEGAEVDIQIIVSWVLYILWEMRYDTEQRAGLRGTDEGGRYGSQFSLEGVNVRKKLLGLRAVEWFLKALFHSVALALGLRRFRLPDMDHLAAISHGFYDNNLRGGEGHMEVGKLIHNVLDNTATMTLSIKPFGCMPSSGVSDGVQTLITELFPQGIFLPIETNGDGAVNVQSRVQMQLFKARQAAVNEVQSALQATGLDAAALQQRLARNRRLKRGPYKHNGPGSSTTASLINTLAVSHWKRCVYPLFRWRHKESAHRAHMAAVESARAAVAASRPSDATVNATKPRTVIPIHVAN